MYKKRYKISATTSIKFAIVTFECLSQMDSTNQQPPGFHPISSLHLHLFGTQNTAPPLDREGEKHRQIHTRPNIKIMTPRVITLFFCAFSSFKLDNAQTE